MADRLISADALRRSLFSQIQSNALNDGRYPHVDSHKNWCISGEEIERAIADIFADDSYFKPTVDAVKVVRCKDCEHYSDNGYQKCRLHSTEPDQYGPGADVCMEPEDFCSYGERRIDHV